MNFVRLFILLFVFGVIAILAVKIYRLENERRLLKEDLIEISNVRYGIFSVDEWRKILSNIITKKVQELNFTGENREAMRAKISTLLYKVIDDFEAQFKKENSRSFKGFFQGLVAEFAGGFGRVREKVPFFTEQIMNFLNDPANKQAIRGYILTKLNEYADNTFSKIDYAAHDAILAKYHYQNREQAIRGLTGIIEGLTNDSKPYKTAILILSLAMIAFLFAVKRFFQIEYILLILISLLLLATGLLLPMIEIDARIERMSFTLIGETISFEDQVLYYKSKSILEVVWLMFKQSRIDVIIVGVLVFVFSVLFPVLKQLASLYYVLRLKARKIPVVEFFVFKTGKWSMADVMVIAIFMSYIGFSGIVSEQLKQIENLSTAIELLTTNKSSLLTGFFFFTGFAVFSLAISQKVEQQFKRNADTE